MNAESMSVLQQVLGWCALINFTILTAWFAVFTLAGNWMRRLHGRWFRMSPERFDAIHYAGMAIYKLGILLFNLVPYLVLRLIS